MNLDEKELSSYIYSLNNEMKPKEHGNTVTSQGLEYLLETVSLAKSLKYTTPATEGYSQNLINTLGNATSNKKKWKLTSRNSLFSLGAIAALVIICITANVILPFGKNNVVQAMSKAFWGTFTNSIQYKITHTSLDFKNNIPKVVVPVDLEVEKNDQKSVDAGHSPWRLDPIFVSQVFLSLKLSPQGIIGDYPIKTEDLKLSLNNGKEAVVEVNGSITPIKKVYLKRLVRPNSTGIWTVVGYDPK